MRLLWKAWELAKLRLGFTENATAYCIECSSCGEDGCCPAERCVGGAFCAGYYGPTRRGPVDELVQLRREADKWSSRLTPKHVDLAPCDVRLYDHDVFGHSIAKGKRLETHAEMRIRIDKEWNDD